MQPSKPLAPLFFLLLLFFTACNNHALSAPEETALRFYKAVWVEGEMKEANNLLKNPHEVKKMNENIQQVGKVRTQNPPILIVESPEDQQMNSKTILIHRPSDKKEYKIQVQKLDSTWKVTHFYDNFDPNKGGYIGYDNYQRFGEEFPGIQWKEIKEP